MKCGNSIASAIHWAISAGRIPDDIVRIIREGLIFFQEDDALYDSPNLQGPAKRAELVVKLGYWLAVGQLTEKEFRLWANCIPPENNAGWDVDLLHPGPQAQTHRVLKMGPLATEPEACLVQASVWDASTM